MGILVRYASIVNDIKVAEASMSCYFEWLGLTSSITSAINFQKAVEEGQKTGAIPETKEETAEEKRIANFARKQWTSWQNEGEEEGELRLRINDPACSIHQSVSSQKKVQEAGEGRKKGRNIFVAISHLFLPPEEGEESKLFVQMQGWRCFTATIINGCTVYRRRAAAHPTNAFVTLWIFLYKTVIARARVCALWKTRVFEKKEKKKKREVSSPSRKRSKWSIKSYAVLRKNKPRLHYSIKQCGLINSLLN